VVYNSVTAFDGCSRIGSTYASITASFPPGSLSTIRPDNSTHSFNFADLPCPPSGVEWTLTGPYAPLVSPPSFLFSMDPAFANCIPAFRQGVDPPYEVVTADGVMVGSSPGLPGPGHKRAIERDNVVPWAPRKTAD